MCGHSHLYPTVLRIQKCVTYSTAKGIFGFKHADNIGKAAFAAVQVSHLHTHTYMHTHAQHARGHTRHSILRLHPVQAAPSFPSAFPEIFGNRLNVPCLIPCAIDQVTNARHKRNTLAHTRTQVFCRFRQKRANTIAHGSTPSSNTHATETLRVQTQSVSLLVCPLLRQMLS